MECYNMLTQAEAEHELRAWSLIIVDMVVNECDKKIAEMKRGVK